MRKITHTFLALLLSVSIYAQAPQSFKYQAIARDGSGQVLDNKDVSFQISILEGSTTGTSVYTETFTATTNQFGLVNLNIGTGNSSDDFTAINWSSNTFFVQIMMDQTGQSDYQLMGTSQMLSVPYALHAKTAENTFSGDYNDLSNTPDLSGYDTDVSNDFNGDYNNLTNTPDLSNYITDETDPVFEAHVANGITTTNITNWNNKLDSYTETDPVYSAWDKSSGISITESQITDLDYFTNTDETDPVFSAHAANSITTTDITNWDNKLDSYTETDPVYSVWDKSSGISITESQITDLVHFTNTDETDPVFGAHAANGISSTDITNWDNKLDSYTETDPIYSAWDKSTGISITESQVSNFGNYESSFTKNSAFNKDFGNVAETVTEGNDSRLSDARTPTSHAASHINGTDDIQNATSSQKGLMTATYATKLDGIATGAEVNVATNLTIGTKTETTLDINSSTGTNVTIPAANTTDAGLMTNAQFDKLGDIETNADVTNATNVDAAGAIMESDFNAGTFLYATSDNTPQPKNISETKTILSLENVENTALSTWEGSGNIASLGTVTSGTLSTGAVLADVTMSLGSDADGDIYYRSGSKLTRLPKGTDDQVLTLETGVPAWKDAAGGGGSLAIGDFYGGGIIFWLDASGNHGLICAIEDQSTTIMWHENATDLVTGATLDAAYAGEANTNIIVTHAGASNAAQLCDEYSVTVNNEYYDNWYLPSHNELVLMYNNKATINTTITSNSGSVLTGNTYWSSTELNFQSAETVYFTNGGEGYVTKTATGISSRAIRAF